MQMHSAHVYTTVPLITNSQLHTVLWQLARLAGTTEASYSTRQRVPLGMHVATLAFISNIVILFAQAELVMEENYDVAGLSDFNCRYLWHL